MLDLKNSSHIIQLLDETVQLLDYRVVKLEVFGLRCCRITEMLDYRVVGLEKSSRFTWLFRLYVCNWRQTRGCSPQSPNHQGPERKIADHALFLSSSLSATNFIRKFHVMDIK